MSRGRTKAGDSGDDTGGGGGALGRESEKRERRKKAHAGLNFPPVVPTGLA
jgi:hypothetical protein